MSPSPSLLSLLKRFCSFGRKQPVVYDNTFFKNDWFTNWSALQDILAELLQTCDHWKRILDFGCGPGIMIDRMNGGSIEYTGFDPSTEARELYMKHYGKHPGKYVHTLPEETFDVMVSFDVFEHMTDAKIQEVVQNTPLVKSLFVNISREKGIPGHINIKTDAQWIAFLNSVGLRFDEETTTLLRNKYRELRPNGEDAWDKNMFVFSR